MTEQLVRGSWLIGSLKFLRNRYSPETNEHLLGSLPKPLKTLLPELEPVAWYARDHHVSLLKALVSAHRDEAQAYQSLLDCGQSVAADMSNGPLRPLIQILTPKLFARKLPAFWASNHGADGKLEADIASLDESRLRLRLLAIQGYDHIGVVTLGWIKGLLMSLGRTSVVVEQSGWKLGQTAPSEMTCEVHWS
jgi:hypothetical protein